MQIGILKELLAQERRVAMVPDTLERLQKMGFEVLIEKGAGEAAGFFDSTYTKKGGKVVEREKVLAADIFMAVNAPDKSTLALLKKGSVWIGLISPALNEALLHSFAEKRVSALAMDAVPRISRAQKLDVLSSMASMAGYRAVLEASYAFDKFLGGQITAAGRIAPARVLVVGAGVAGLSAIGTASKMGAVVRAFDTRAEVKDQIESLGGTYLTVSVDEDTSSVGGYAKSASEALLKAELELFAEEAKQVDIIITTALIPGRPAPKLIDEKVIQNLKSGSVIVDLAAPNGGNTTATVPSEKIITPNNVTIIGYTDLVSRMAGQASNLYSNNLYNLMGELSKQKDGTIQIPMDDPMIRAIVVAHEGSVTFPAPPVAVSAPVAPKKPTETPKSEEKKQSAPSFVRSNILIALLGVALVVTAAFSDSDTLRELILFILASLIGYQVIWRVSSSLHTPLMSITNAISGVGMFGAMALVGVPQSLITYFMGFGAVVFAAINVFGGLAVTSRMLSLFKNS